MEFSEKLQQLRKQKGITQEALAQALYVSRTAISKWESGKGFPNISSLQAIAKFFSVSVDELLSGERILSLAQEEQRHTHAWVQTALFGLLDICFLVYLVLPLFCVRRAGEAVAMSLLQMYGDSPVVAAGCLCCVVASFVWGVDLLALQRWQNRFWLRIRYAGSLLIHGLALVLFILCLQPYAAVLALLFLVVKGILLLKKP